MTQPQPEQIQVDRGAVIDGIREISGHVVGGLMHDLAVTRAALAGARDEVARLTRVNEGLTAKAEPPGAVAHRE